MPPSIKLQNLKIEDKERFEKLMQESIKANEENRQLRHKDEEREIEMQRKLLVLEEKIRDDAVKKASEEKAGGSLTVKDGVKSEFYKPTDYSPIR